VIAAQARLGHQYASGLGVPRDLDARSVGSRPLPHKTIRPAARLGILFGGATAIAASTRARWSGSSPERPTQFDGADLLATLLLFGEDVAHDAVRAAGLLEKAAEAGQPAAMFHLVSCIAPAAVSSRALRMRKPGCGVQRPADI